MRRLSRLLLILGLSGCAGAPPPPEPAPPPPLPRVAGRLAFEDVRSGRDAAILLGGFEHVLALSRPGADEAPGAPRHSGSGREERLVQPPRETVHFAFDSARLSAAERARLNAFLDSIGGAAWTAFRVEGHADATGPDRYNQALSARRADTVRRLLERLGVPGERIDAAGFGERRPAASNATPGGRAQNRRAEVTARPSDRTPPP